MTRINKLNSKVNFIIKMRDFNSCKMIKIFIRKKMIILKLILELMFYKLIQSMAKSEFNRIVGQDILRQLKMRPQEGKEIITLRYQYIIMKMILKENLIILPLSTITNQLIIYLISNQHQHWRIVLQLTIKIRMNLNYILNSLIIINHL